MKKVVALLFAIAFLAIATAPWGSSGQGKEARAWHPNENKFLKVEKSLERYIVVLKDDVPAAEVNSRAASLVRNE